MFTQKYINFLTEKICTLITEGGLWGHMSHLYEDPNLSFREIKEVFDLANEGKLENVTEKTDGQNVFFSYDLGGGGLRFARNQSHIKKGGIGAQEIIEKWSNIPHIKDAFHNAYLILSQAIESLNAETIIEIFGNNANIWYSAEIIYSGSPNVINYDRNALAIHESGMVYNDDGKPIEEADASSNFKILYNKIQQMQKAIESTGWTIMGPVVTQIQKATQGNAAAEAKSKLDNEIQKYGLSDANTIQNYIEKKFSAYAKSFVKDISDEEAIEFGKIFADQNISGGQKKKTALEINSSKEVERLFLAKNARKIMSKMLKPLEMIVHDFAVDVLDGMQSVIALHPDKEVKRLQQAVKDAIEKIRNSGDEKALEVLTQQLEKLKSVDKITSSVEGIVFRYKGKEYKLTGNFAPVNQLLGLLRF